MTDARDSYGSRLRLVGLSAGAGIAGKLVQFGALTFLALILSQDDYGRLAILQALILGISSIASSSFAFASNKAAATLLGLGSVSTLGDALAAVLRGRLWAIPIVVLANFALLPVLYRMIAGSWMPVHLLPLGALSAAVVITDTALGVVAGFGRYKIAGSADGSRAALAGATALALAAPFGVTGAAYGLVAVDAIAAASVIVYVLSRRSERLTRGVVVESHRNVTLSGLASNTLAQLGNWLLLFVVQSAGGLAGVGAYSIANRFASLVLLATGYLNRNMLGDLARVVAMSDPSALTRALRFYLLAVLGIASAASLGAFLSLPLVFHGVAEGYPDSVPLLGVLLAATIIRACATYLGIVCVAFHHLRSWILSDVAGFLVLVASLLFVLIDSSSLLGIGVSLIMSNAACLVYRVAALSSARWSPRRSTTKDEHIVID